MATFSNGETGLSVRTKINNILQHADGTVNTLVFNEAGADINVRIEGVGQPYAFFLDGGTSNVGIGTTGVNSKLTVAGDSNVAGISTSIAMRDSTRRRITSPGGGSYLTGQAQTGAIAITLPVGYTNHMVRFTVKIFEYSTQESFEIVVAGYNVASVPAWQNTSAYIISSNATDRDYTVRFGFDATSSKCVIYIGELNTAWSFPQINVTDVQLGYTNGNLDLWDTDWSIAFETVAFQNVTSTRTNNRVGARLYGAGQTTAALTDAGTRSDLLRLSSSSTAAGGGGGIIFTNSQADTADSLGMAAIKGLLVSGAGNTQGDLAFSTRASTAATNLTERMRITAAGDVGIGTASPTYKLEILATTNDGILLDDGGLSSASPSLKVRGKRSDSNGSQSFAGKLLLEGNRTDAAVVANKQLGVIAFGGNHTDGNVANVLYAASISGTAEGTFSSASAMPTALTFFTGSTGILDTVVNQTMGTERMRISATGGVSIGSTADPGSTNLSVAGVVSHSVGSAATPSITFTGDPDTGIYSSALNALAISTGGVQRARFSADSVIIPAVSTEAKVLEIGQGRAGDGISAIDLVGDATYTDYGARLIRTAGGANGNSQLQHRGTGGLQLIAQDAGVMQFLTSNAERMRISPTGDVGIGITAPVMPLDIDGDTLCRGVEYNIQPTQTSIAAAATLTIAQLLTKIIQYTGAVANLTLPTGTLIEGGIHTNSPNNTAFDFSVINTGSGAATILTSTGLTLVGSMVVTNGDSGLFRVRKTATNTFTVYRIG